MQTRVRKWEKYRKENTSDFLDKNHIINSSPFLEKQLQELFAAFPLIEQDFKNLKLTSDTSWNNVDIQNLNLEPIIYNVSNLEFLLTEINKIAQKDQINVSHFRNLDFSSHDLDDFIQKLNLENEEANEKN
ncbi:hypothetical protein ACW95P_00335 [Candidatus Mycoplasma pogonae]